LKLLSEIGTTNPTLDLLRQREATTEDDPVAPLSSPRKPKERRFDRKLIAVSLLS
jgi:hypothetical protein